MNIIGGKVIMNYVPFILITSLWSLSIFGSESLPHDDNQIKRSSPIDIHSSVKNKRYVYREQLTTHSSRVSARRSTFSDCRINYVNPEYDSSDSISVLRYPYNKVKSYSYLRFMKLFPDQAIFSEENELESTRA